MKIFLKALLLAAYALIILMGQIIGLPFFIWLIATLFDFGNPEQGYAFLGVVGLILVFTSYWNSRWIKLLSFILMLSPILKRLYETPIEKFNYLAFQVPLAVFVIIYLVLIFRSDDKKQEKAM